MAVTLKRKREAISYKEPSTDEESSADSGNDYESSEKRAAPVRRSVRHKRREPEERSKQPRRNHSDTTTTKPKPKPSRLCNKRVISYKESSSDEEFDGDYGGGYASENDKPQASTGRSPRIRRPKSSVVRPKRALGAPLKRRITPPQVSAAPQKIVSDGVIPDWASLPYHVLLQIFVYASHPLHDENMVPTSSISWLTEMARMCMNFAKPALTALYRNPPIFAIRQNRKDLVHHLITPKPGARGDYSVMVKRLELDVTRLTRLTDPTHSVADLAALVSSLTTLREIDIFDPWDRPPYRARLKRIKRWHYPNELFAAIREGPLKLRSWRWNNDFYAKDLLWMKDIHSYAAFQSLREVIFTKFHPDKPNDPESNQPSVEELLGSVLAVLPNLRTLVFEACTVVNKRLLPLLPKNLVSLNLTNCKDITSDALQPFLVTHGGRLEELILNHNQSLDISFLVDLKLSCPRLELLRMDMNYFSSFATVHDNEPLYDELLKEVEIPSWPASLRVLDMEYLRNWTATAATNFFTSLIDAAEELPCLREITILASVDVDWRKRAEYRQKWTARFQHVFARKTGPPAQHLMSMRAFREWKASQGLNEHPGSFVENMPKSGNRVENRGHEESEDSDVPLLSSRKRRQDETWDSNRLRSRGKSSYHEDSSEDDPVVEVASDDEERLFVQGMCRTVLVRVDNFRPREEIYDEGDFLDTELSGDEDWNGNDVVEDGYAW